MENEPIAYSELTDDELKEQYLRITEAIANAQKIELYYLENLLVEIMREIENRETVD